MVTLRFEFHDEHHMADDQMRQTRRCAFIRVLTDRGPSLRAVSGTRAVPRPFGSMQRVAAAGAGARREHRPTGVRWNLVLDATPTEDRAAQMSARSRPPGNTAPWCRRDHG
jgi:hypothetical protein